MLRQAVEAGEIRRAVIVGGGFIGLEIAENLAAKDVKVSVIDFAPHILPGFLDPEIADYVEISWRTRASCVLPERAWKKFSGRRR